MSPETEESRAARGQIAFTACKSHAFMVQSTTPMSNEQGYYYLTTGTHF
jgi:hypothetical protein